MLFYQLTLIIVNDNVASSYCCAIYIILLGSLIYQPYQSPYQQQLPRQQYIPATQQIRPTHIVPTANMTMPPSMMPASDAMLRTAPYMPYMANTSAAQQPPIQHSANFQAVGKQSKAIKIVNPETMKEVDILKSMSPSSHSPPESPTESGLQTVETSVELKDKEVCYIAKRITVIANYVLTNTILQSYWNMHMYVCYIIM